MKEKWFIIDEYSLFYRVYCPINQPVDGVVQIVHNVSEHGGRYDEVAEFFMDYGYVVYVMDLPGHGQTKDMDIPGDAVSFMIGTLHQLQEKIRRDWSDLSVSLLGHGLGGLIALGAQQMYQAWDSLILSSPSRGSFPQGERLMMGINQRVAKSKANGLAKLSLSLLSRDKNLNSRSHAWRSRDVREWMNYFNDPLCGLAPSPAMKYSLSKAKTSFFNNDQILRLPSQKAVLILAGTKDLVGHQGKDALRFARNLNKVGLSKVYLRLYKDARYDLFWDEDREEVFYDLLQFLRQYQ